MRDNLSKRERAVLEFIRTRVIEDGSMPSIREIGRALGLSSTSSVHSKLRALERRGFISRDSTKSGHVAINLDGTTVESRQTEDLTPRQRAILEFIRSSQADLGYPPSILEIRDAVGLSSTSSVRAQLATLEHKGFLRRNPGKARAIEIEAHDSPIQLSPGGRSEHIVEVPLLGTIAAGDPVLAVEYAEDVLPLPQELLGSGEFFALRVRGDSMIESGILPGDYVIVRVLRVLGDYIRDRTGVSEGDIVAVVIGDEATVKHYSEKNGRVQLLPANSGYGPIELHDDDEIYILGKVVGVWRGY
jgi:repressor LexA